MEVDLVAMKRMSQELLTSIEQQLTSIEQPEGPMNEIVDAVKQMLMHMAQAQLSSWEEMCPHHRDGFVPYRFCKAATQGLVQVLCELQLDFECNDVVVAAEQVEEYVPLVARVREIVLNMRSSCESLISRFDSGLARMAFRSVRGHSYLHLAVCEGDNERVRRLLRQGFEVDALSNNLRTPLMFAAIEENLVAIGYLVDFGADTNVHMEGIGTTLHLACGAINPIEAVVNRLLWAGADERELNLSGKTPLYLLKGLNSEK